MMNAPAALLLSLLAASSTAARDRSIELRSSSTPMPAPVLAGGTDAALDEGRALLAAANPVQAIAAFRTALASDPQSVAALNGLAVAYDRLGRADLARQHFEQALAFEPDAADIAYNLGWSLLKAGQYRDAIAPLQRASASRDARAASAAQRALAIVAARLAAPAVPVAGAVQDAMAQPAVARIDMVASGEAVLVLAAAPPPAFTPAAPAALPAAAAPIATAMAGQLGDAASLTIPASAAVPSATATAAVVPPQPLRPNVPVRPPAPASLVAVSQPRPLPSPLRPLPRAVLAASAPTQAIMLPASAWHQPPAVLPPAVPPPGDRKAEIRLAIARLEWLLDQLGARHA